MLSAAPQVCAAGPGWAGCAEQLHQLTAALAAVHRSPLVRADRPVVLLKGGRGVDMPPLADANINLNTILYLKSTDPSGSSGSGLSAGAIAGIAVGAVCAAAMLAGAAGVCYVRRRRRRQQAQDLAVQSKALQIQVLASSEVRCSAGGVCVG